MRLDSDTTRRHAIACPTRGDAPAVLRRVLAWLRDDRGAAAVSFILAFPIFLTIVAILVQMALMVNAKMAVQHAADSAARAAATSLPDGHPENVNRAAWMALAPVSPQATTGTASEAATDYDALRQLGVDVAESFPARYTYATEATTVSWSPDGDEVDFARSEGQEVEVTVTYRFRLTVPGAMKFADAEDDTVAGVKGRFWEVTGTSRVQTAHGRKARAYENGWPR